MSRLVRLLVGVGVALGGLGALGWHRQTSVFARTWPPAWIELPSGGPLYSGFVADNAVSDWSRLWWPAVVVMPLFGATLGAALGGLLAALVPRRHQALGGLAAIVVLGVLVGVASALAWHVDPGSSSGIGVGWVGGLEEGVDVGYPAIGLALGLLAAAIAGRTEATATPSRAPGEAR